MALLALASNAIHLLWKWPRNDNNPSGKVTHIVTVFVTESDKLLIHDLCNLVHIILVLINEEPGDCFLLFLLKAINACFH